MLNKIWFGLIAIGIVYGFAKGVYHDFNGQPPALEAPAEEPGAGGGEEEEPQAFPCVHQVGKDLNTAVVDAATLSVEICLGLIGFMALWLGVLNIATDAGLVDALARMLRPLMRWLFPEVPDGHPAQGAMLMNIAANMLNLENAATPMGLKAMKELQTLNDHRDTATNSMAMFLTINTSNVCLVPFTIMAYRAQFHSENPPGPFLGILLATSVATIVGIVAARFLSKLPRYAMPSTPSGDNPDSPSVEG